MTYRHGSFPELIDHESTGFLCTNEQEMVHAVRCIGELDRGRCHQIFEERFTAEQMTTQYIQVYESMIKEPAVASFADE